MRLIDPNALVEHIKDLPTWWADDGGVYPGGSMKYPDGMYYPEDIISSIDNAPTVDAIVSPVKIGQVLWCNIPHSEFPLECRVYCICREERNGLALDYFRCAVKGWFGKAFSFEDIGKTVFFTKEEALAKMDGGNGDGVDD